MQKMNKGVTLIALAITVIVILILAGISIGTLKNDGTLDKTQSSAKIETTAEEENVIRLAYTQMEMNDGIVNSNLTLESFKTYMSKHTKEYYIDENVTEEEKTKAIATIDNATKFVKVIFNNTGNSYIIGLSEETEKPTYDYYTITYDANGGTDAPKEQYNRIGYPAVIISDTPNRNNFNFEGWAIASVSKEISYMPGSTYIDGKNITLYAVWKDTTQPIIDSITTTSNSLTIKAHDDETGISGYAISTTDEIPTKFTNITNQTSITQVISPLIQSTTYYVWVKNEDGLISEVKSIKTETIPGVSLNADKTTWTNGNVVVTAKSNSSTTGYTIQSCTDNKSWKNENSITFTQNGTMYARLIDSTGQTGSYATYNVKIIDKIAPNITIKGSASSTIATKATIEISSTEELGGSGIKSKGVYLYKNGESAKLQTQATIENLQPNTTYYAYGYISDNAGNEKKSSILTIKTGLAIAEYNQIKYTSVQNAFNAISSSGTVKLLTNQTESATVPNGKNITFLLNGKTMQYSNKYVLLNNGTLSIQGSGKLVSATGTIINAGNLSLKNVDVDLTKSGWTISNYKTLSIQGGNIKYSGDSNGCAIMTLENSNTNIDGITINSVAYGLVTRNTKAVSTVKNSKISITGLSTHYAIWAQDGGEITVTSTTISNNRNSTNGAAVVANNANSKISLYNSNINGNLASSVGKDDSSSYVYLFNSKLDGNIYRESKQGKIVEVVSSTTGFDIYYFDNYLWESSLRFPTWTENKGQDDIIWYDGKIGNRHNGRMFYCRVNKSEHNNENGKYITHIYEGMDYKCALTYN